jgi:transposase
MVKQLSSEEKSAIVTYFNSGKPIKELAEKYGKTPSTIYRVLQKYKNKGSFECPKQSGHSKVCTMPVIKFIIAKTRNYPKLGSRKLKILLKESLGISISCRTIRNYLVSIGFELHVQSHF